MFSFGRFLSLAMAIAFSATALASVEWRLITTLDRFEPFDAHAFHEGHLWVGKSRTGLGADYRLEVYDPAASRVADARLGHSLRFLYPYGPKAILTVGVSASDQLTHFTVATLEGKRIRLQSTKIPLGAYANEWAGGPGRLFFTDPGGLDDGSPIGTPLRTLFTFRNQSSRYLKPRIRGPRNPRLVGDHLYVVEHPSIETGGRTLYRVSLRDESMKPIAAGSDIINVLVMDGGKTLALADRGADAVILVDTAAGKETKRLTIAAGAPRGLAQLGRCLVVATERSKRILFLDRETGETVADWDASVAGLHLFGLRNLAVDPRGERVYVRSAFAASPVDPGPEERNSVVSFEETDPAALSACR